jgi:hypothetical protein
MRSRQDNRFRSPEHAHGAKRAAFWTVLAALTLAVVTAGGLLISFAAHALRGAQPRDFEDMFRKDGQLGAGGALQPGLDARVIDGLGGTVRWKNNSQGFRSDVDYAPTPPPGTLRIMIVGDSFVSGYRVDQSKTFGMIIQERLTAALGRPVEALIVHEGDGGCPASGLRYFLEFGRSFRPHILILGLTLGNDIAQAYVALHEQGRYELDTSRRPPRLIVKNGVKNPLGFRHGLEELILPPDSVEGATATPRFPLLSRAHDFIRPRLFPRTAREAPQRVKSYYESLGLDGRRLFDPATGLGMFLKSPPKEVKEAYASLCRLIDAFNAACEPEDVIFTTAIFPQRFQVQEGDWEETVRAYGLRRAAFDLFRPNKEIRACCGSRSIRMLDPTKAMVRFRKERRKNLYLPEGDTHWNDWGHEAFAEAAAPFLERAFRELRNKGGEEERSP